MSRDRQVHVVITWHMARLFRRVAACGAAHAGRRDRREDRQRCRATWTCPARSGGCARSLSPSRVRGGAPGRAAAGRRGAERGGRRRRLSGPRPFGYEDDHVTERPAEADAIRWAADSLLAGGVRDARCMREWNAARPASPRRPAGRSPGSPITDTILRNPRLAGLAVYQRRDASTADRRAGRDPGRADRGGRSTRCWPTRRASRRRGVRTLLGGLAACPCGNVVDGRHQPPRRPRVPVPARDPRRTGPARTSRSAPSRSTSTWSGSCWTCCPGRAGVPGDPAAARGHGGAARRGRRDPPQPRRDGRRPGARARSPAARCSPATERGNARLAEIGAELAEAAGAGALAPFTRGHAAAPVWDGLTCPAAAR